MTNYDSTKIVNTDYRIAFCGAHGTGKTTLVELVSTNYDIPKLSGTLRAYWQSIGVS